LNRPGSRAFFKFYQKRNTLINAFFEAYIDVRLTPQDSRALPEPAPAKAGGAFYGAVEFGRFFDFLRVHHLWFV